MDPPRHPGMAVRPRSFSKVLGYNQWWHQDWIWSLADSTGQFSPKSIAHTYMERSWVGGVERPPLSLSSWAVGGGLFQGHDGHQSGSASGVAFWFWWWRLGHSLAVLAGFTPDQHPWPCCGTDRVAAAAPRGSRTPGSLPCPGRSPCKADADMRGSQEQSGSLLCT